MNKLIGDLMIHSYQKPYLRFSHEVFEALSTLLSFLGEKVHHHPVFVPKYLVNCNAYQPSFQFPLCFSYEDVVEKRRYLKNCEGSRRRGQHF